MAFYDSLLQLSSAQAITTTAASTNLYDISGAGSGNAASQVYGVNPTTGAAIQPGADIGTGDGMATPTAVFTVTTTGTGAGTVTFSVQAAPDNGSNSPGTYVTLSSSAAMVGTALIKGNQVVLPIPPFAQIAPAMGLPRFYRFNYTVAGSATVSVTAGILLNPGLGYVSTQYAPNFIATL
jgi:hypothetical protein